LDLTIADRQGVEIDYCPKCRGVWLDRGELDKILERSVVKQASAYEDADYEEGDFPSRTPRSGDDRSAPHPPKKRGSFLSELFDFG